MKVSIGKYNILISRENMTAQKYADIYELADSTMCNMDDFDDVNIIISSEEQSRLYNFLFKLSFLYDIELT